MTHSTHKLHTTGQTTKLQKIYNIAYELRLPFTVVTVTILLIALIISLLLVRSEPPRADLQPVLIVSTPTPTRTPVVTVTPLAHTQLTESQLNAAVVAYDAPDGNVLGPIDAHRAYTITARYGTDWLQADIVGSGLVWIRSREIGTVTIAAALPDLRPVPTAEVVYVMQAQLAPSEQVKQRHSAVRTSPHAVQPTPIYEKPTPVLTEAEQFWKFPTAVPLPRTPGVEVSSNAYEACRRSGKAFGDCKQHMPDDYWIVRDQ
ncbi:MAG: hypothetical protein AAGF95_26325 [Chloroflexota bacterium]